MVVGLRWLGMSFAVAALVIGAACGSGGTDDDSGSTDALATSPSADGVLTIKMFDNSFKPKDVTVKAGSTVTFKLPNVGQLPHNMRIASLRGIYRESEWASKPEPLGNPGTTSELVWQAPEQPGTYKFRCDIHEGMVGTITVE